VRALGCADPVATWALAAGADIRTVQANAAAFDEHPDGQRVFVGAAAGGATGRRRRRPTDRQSGELTDARGRRVWPQTSPPKTLGWELHPWSRACRTKLSAHPARVARMFDHRSNALAAATVAVSTGSCSQIRTTCHPAASIARVTRRSRSTFRASFGARYHSLTVA
jgi:hypothetical protein